MKQTKVRIQDAEKASWQSVMIAMAAEDQSAAQAAEANTTLIAIQDTHEEIQQAIAEAAEAAEEASSLFGNTVIAMSLFGNVGRMCIKTSLGVIAEAAEEAEAAAAKVAEAAAEAARLRQQVEYCQFTIDTIAEEAAIAATEAAEASEEAEKAAAEAAEAAIAAAVAAADANHYLLSIQNGHALDTAAAAAVIAGMHYAEKSPLVHEVALAAEEAEAGGLGVFGNNAEAAEEARGYRYIRLAAAEAAMFAKAAEAAARYTAALLETRTQILSTTITQAKEADTKAEAAAEASAEAKSVFRVKHGIWLSDTIDGVFTLAEAGDALIEVVTDAMIIRDQKAAEAEEAEKAAADIHAVLDRAGYDAEIAAEEAEEATKAAWEAARIAMCIEAAAEAFWAAMAT